MLLKTCEVSAGLALISTNIMLMDLKKIIGFLHVIMIGGKGSWASSLPNYCESVGLSQAIAAGIMSHLDALIWYEIVHIFTS